MKIPPKIELKTSFKTHFIGTIKILPIMNNKQIQDINIRIFKSKIIPPQKNSSFITTISMFYFGQIFYTAILFFLNNLVLNSFALFNTNPFLFAIFIK